MNTHSHTDACVLLGIIGARQEGTTGSKRQARSLHAGSFQFSSKPYTQQPGTPKGGCLGHHG